MDTKLNVVSSTLYIPLFWRAKESLRPDALVRDAKAVELMRQLNYDVSTYGSIFMILRMREIDRRVRRFLAAHPGGGVVDIGCGLDTRFYRVDDGLVRWVDLDLPEVMAIRGRLLTANERQTFIGCSVLDSGWMDMIDRSLPLLFVAEGVFPYLEEAEVRQVVTALCERFPGSELVFDGLPGGFVRWSRFHPALRSSGARLRWGLDDGRVLEQWHPALHLMEEWFYFDDPEPRLRPFRLLRWIPAISKTRIVHYQLGQNRDKGPMRAGQVVG